MTGPRRGRPPLVRPYLATGGRVRPSRPLFDVLTVLHAPGELPVTALSPEKRRLVELCSHGLLPLLDAAGALDLPITVTKILVDDLVVSGHLLTRLPIEKATMPQVALLERVRDALRAL